MVRRRIVTMVILRVVIADGRYMSTKTIVLLIIILLTILTMVVIIILIEIVH